jgi:hypothetical protein
MYFDPYNCSLPASPLVTWNLTGLPIIWNMKQNCCIYIHKETAMVHKPYNTHVQQDWTLFIGTFMGCILERNSPTLIVSGNNMVIMLFRESFGDRITAGYCGLLIPKTWACAIFIWGRVFRINCIQHVVVDFTSRNSTCTECICWM